MELESGAWLAVPTSVWEYENLLYLGYRAAFTAVVNQLTRLPCSLICEMERNASLHGERV